MSFLPFCPRLYKGCIAKLFTNGPNIGSWHTRQYDKLNGLDVEYYEIHLIKLQPYHYKNCLTLYEVVVSFTHTLSYEDISEFLDMGIGIEVECLKEEDIPKYYYPDEKNVIYKYEGVRSKTKSAAKIT